jgi:hypothetical protein
MNKFLALLVLLLAAPGRAEQHLPPCEDLSRLWQDRFYGRLNPDWARHPLRCGVAIQNLTQKESRDLAFAAAAYFLDKTIWTGSPYSFPVVAWGGIGAPPDSMLDWVAQRTTGVSADLQTVDEKGNPIDSAYRDKATGRIHLTPRNFDFVRYKGKSDFDALHARGATLAGQLVHEARHQGYDHVACADGTYNCDPTVSEEFYGGGSHGVASLWSAWIARASAWPEAAKAAVREQMEWVLRYRINDHDAADAFSCRYLGKRLLDVRKKCLAYR